MAFDIYCSFGWEDQDIDHGFPRATHWTHPGFDIDTFTWVDAGLDKMIQNADDLDALLVVDIEWMGPAPKTNLPLLISRAQNWISKHPDGGWTAAPQALIDHTVSVLNEGAAKIKAKAPAQRKGIYQAFPPRVPGRFGKLYENPGDAAAIAGYEEWLDQAGRQDAVGTDYDVVCPDLYSPWRYDQRDYWMFWARKVVGEGRKLDQDLMPYLTLHSPDRNDQNKPYKLIEEDLLRVQLEFLKGLEIDGAILWCRTSILSYEEYKPLLDIAKEFV